MKAVVFNLGCKVNKYECDCMMRQLSEKGIEVTDTLEEADLYIINTCAVTGEAERKSRQCIARCRKLNPQAEIIVTGCAAQDDPEPFCRAPGVIRVSGVAGKQKIADALAEKGSRIDPLPLQYEEWGDPVTDRTRAFVKVQDGCDNFCSYCLIPYLRGRSRSRDKDKIVEECIRLSGQVGEIVLTGIDLSSYGKGSDQSLTLLIEALSRVDCRIRLGSLEAGVISEEFLRACKGLKSFCPQFHLSLQSGCNATLKAMNRHYTTDEYAEKVNMIRRYFPRAGITTDLICGYPSEDEEQFEQTLEFIGNIGFSHMHIFGYSSRKGTVAARLKPLPPQTVKDRCRRAEEVAQKCKLEYLNDAIGKEAEVLFEQCECGAMAGWSKEYVRYYLPQAYPGEILKVRGVSLYGEGLLCERI